LNQPLDSFDRSCGCCNASSTKSNPARFGDDSNDLADLVQPLGQSVDAALKPRHRLAQPRNIIVIAFRYRVGIVGSRRSQKADRAVLVS
jgi:hypothetical protein